MRVLADGQTDRQTDTHTDANRFYNLSNAICYSYGTDNKLLHTVFQLVPTLVTLNDLTQRNSPYFALFH